MEEVDKEAVGENIPREDMTKLWSTEDLLGQDERELLVWQHRLKHCSFRSLLRLSNRGIITRKISNIIIENLVLPVYLGIATRVHGGPKANA